MNRVLCTMFAVIVAASCARGEGVPTDGGGPPTDGTSMGDVVGTKDSAADVPHVPKLESTFPPYGLAWTPTGNLGRAGGLTWTYTGIQRGSLLHIYWVVCDDPTMPCGVSLDGPITAASEWQFDMTNSNLLSGKLVFTNATAITTSDAGTVPLNGRLTVTLVDSGNSAEPFATVASLGVTARAGKYGAEIKGTGFTVTALIEVEDTSTSTWTPYLDYYDNAHTVPPDAGNAYVSFGGSFYDD
jgi:hypothetical protein